MIGSESGWRRALRFAVSVLFAAGLLWAYWPTITGLVRAWRTQPDYSHGFLVIPFAIYFLWLRRESFPSEAIRFSALGLLLLAASVGLRVAGGSYFLGGVDGFSMVVWIAGAVCLIGGPHLLRWSLPAIVFLAFMVPLPYRLGLALRWPLARVATETSCAALQMLGQPALAEGNTIILGAQQLEVEQACSGLRILVGVLALAAAFVIAGRREPWANLLLLISAIPVALLANCLRIVVTALLFQHAADEAARRFQHDMAGWFTTLAALAMFLCLLCYLHLAVRYSPAAGLVDLVRSEGLPAAARRSTHLPTTDQGHG